MNSVFNQLLIKLQTRLLAQVPDDANNIGIRYIDQDLSQLEGYDTMPAVSFPCVLVDFAQAQYEQKQFKAQWAEMNISFRLAFNPYSSSSSLTPADTREKALVYYEIENKIYQALQDWDADKLLMNPLRRISAATEKRQDKIRVRQIVFRAKYEDLAQRNI